MKRIAPLFCLLVIAITLLSQTKTIQKDKVNIPSELRSLFIKQAQEKRDVFVDCIKTIATSSDLNRKKRYSSIGINLFEDSAHIWVSNATRNKTTSYTPIKYFKDIVPRYYNATSPTIVWFKTSPVYVDKVLKDEKGKYVGVEGHFQFSQIFCKDPVVEYTTGGDHVPIYKYNYCDSTNKVGRIVMTPENTPSGIQWVVLLSGISVESTTKK